MRRSLRNTMGLVSAIVSCAFVMSGSLADGCQFVHTIDPDNQRVQVFPVGSTIQYKKFDLRDGGSNRLSDIDFARVPGMSQRASFVTQGHYLRVIDHGPGAMRTIDIESLTGMDNLHLSGVAAAEALEIRTPGHKPEIQYALYLAGHSSQGPQYIVLDQQAILAGEPGSTMLIASGPLCVSGLPCAGSTRSIAVANTPHPADPQVAFASVLGRDENSLQQQHFYRITRGDAPDGPFKVTLDSWQRGMEWGGSRHRYLGVDFDAVGQVAAGVFQTGRELRDLKSGTSSCPFDPEPTDVALWGPSKGIDAGRLQFVVYDTAEGAELAASPWLECLDDTGPLSSQAPVSNRPSAVSLSSRQARQFWAYVAGGHGAVTAIHYELVNGKRGEQLLQIGSIELSNPDDCQPNGRATQLSMGALDLSFDTCPDEIACEGNPDPPVPCCLDPDDPDPDCDDCSGLIPEGTSGPFDFLH